MSQIMKSKINPVARLGQGPNTHVVSSVSRNCERIFSNLKTGTVSVLVVGGPYVPNNHHFYKLRKTK